MKKEHKTGLLIFHAKRWFIFKMLSCFPLLFHSYFSIRGLWGHSYSILLYINDVVYFSIPPYYCWGNLCPTSTPLLIQLSSLLVAVKIAYFNIIKYVFYIFIVVWQNVSQMLKKTHWAYNLISFSQVKTF